MVRHDCAFAVSCSDTLYGEAERGNATPPGAGACLVPISSDVPGAATGCPRAFVSLTCCAALAGR